MVHYHCIMSRILTRLVTHTQAEFGVSLRGLTQITCLYECVIKTVFTRRSRGRGREAPRARPQTPLCTPHAATHRLPGAHAPLPLLHLQRSAPAALAAAAVAAPPPLPPHSRCYCRRLHPALHVQPYTHAEVALCGVAGMIVWLWLDLWK